MFNKIFLFLLKNISDPPFSLEKNFDPPFDLRKSTLSPQFSGALLLVKNDTFLTIKQYKSTVFLFMTSYNTRIIGFFQLKNENPVLSKVESQ